MKRLYFFLPSFFFHLRESRPAALTAEKDVGEMKGAPFSFIPCTAAANDDSDERLCVLVPPLHHPSPFPATWSH